MKTLMAVMTCHSEKYRAKANAQRATWASGSNVRFFLGRPTIEQYGCSVVDGRVRSRLLDIAPAPDEVWLDVDDGYKELVYKVRAMFKWALDAGYDYVWKVDDDVYLRPERLLAIPKYEYCGIGIMIGWPYKYPYGGEYQVCEGGCYGLGSIGLRLLAGQTLLAPTQEDIWAGMTLHSKGISLVHLGDYTKPGVLMTSPIRKGVPRDKTCPYPEPIPGPDNEVAASWEYTPQQMLEIHRRFKETYENHNCRSDEDGRAEGMSALVEEAA